jgi:hypothetical protein
MVAALVGELAHLHTEHGGASHLLVEELDERGPFAAYSNIWPITSRRMRVSLLRFTSTSVGTPS